MKDSQKKTPTRGGGAKLKKQKQFPTKSDYARINAAALGCLDRIVQHFCPGGKLNGREYLPLNPRRADSTPGSFSINLDSGKWADFAEDASGGDAVSLVSYLLGAAHQSEGLRALAAFLAMPAVEGDHPGPGSRSRKRRNPGRSCQFPRKPWPPSQRPTPLLGSGIPRRGNTVTKMASCCSRYIALIPGGRIARYLFR